MIYNVNIVSYSQHNSFQGDKLDVKVMKSGKSFFNLYNLHLTFLIHRIIELFEESLVPQTIQQWSTQLKNDK